MISRDPFQNIQLQVCMLDNNRIGNSYAVLMGLTRQIITEKEDAITEAQNNSQAIPTLMAYITNGGIKERDFSVFDSHAEQPTDVITSFLKRQFLFGLPNPEFYRVILIPLGMSNATESKEIIEQLNHDIRNFTMSYYDFTNSTPPRLNYLGKVSLPNPERYCEFIPNEILTTAEEQRLMHQRTKSALCVSHGRLPTAKFNVRMVELSSSPKVESVKYLKQTGELIDLPIEKFEMKLARARGSELFSFTNRLRISAVQNDFNEGLLAPPDWKFASGYQSALSIQHDFHCLYNPTLITQLCGRNLQVEKPFLTQPMPKVYFAHIGAMNSYGVFAAEGIPGNTLLDIYAGDLVDDHPHPLSLLYSFLLHVPGYTYSTNQAIYAFDSGNATTLINSAPMPDKNNQRTPGAKANVVAEPRIYKKTPIMAYYTLPNVTITKGTQLLVDYENLLKTECPRYFSFLAKGTEVCAAEANITYSKEDHTKGRVLYKAKDFVAAKKCFKTAYHLVKANYTAKLSLNLATVCEDLGDTYQQLGNKGKTGRFFQEALALRKGVKSADNEKRMATLGKKLSRF